jgi:5'-nucleotidase
MFAAISVALIFAACSAAAPSSRSGVTPPTAARSKPVAQPEQITLSVLGINDLHGRISALPLFAGYVENLRAERAKSGGAVVLVDAGDMFQGTLESNLTEGASVIAAYNKLGMHAAALGNHEFDFGPGVHSGNRQAEPQAALKARLSEAKFPIVCANLVDSSGKTPAWQNLRPSALTSIANVRVGFIGVLTESTPKIVMPAYFSGLNVTPAHEAITRESAALRSAGASVVIVLAHEGADCLKFENPTDISSCSKSEDKIFQIANALPPGTVDAIIAGHTHAGVAHQVNGISIAEAYSKAKAFSRIDIRVDIAKQRVLETRVFPPEALCPDEPCKTQADYEGRKVAADATIWKTITPALDLAARRRHESLGVTVDAMLPAEHGMECALGNLFADLMLQAVPGSDVAIGNGGSLRHPLPQGELLYGSLYEAMPFDNYLASVSITGAELRQVLTEHFASPGHSQISLAGMTVQATCKEGALTVVMRRNSGKLIDDREKLLLATSDYLATGGDKFFAPAKLTQDDIRIDPKVLVRDAFAAGLTKRKQVKSSDFFDARAPRVRTPSERPVRCATSR